MRRFSRILYCQEVNKPYLCPKIKVMTGEEQNKYARTILTEEQMQELEERFFSSDVYAREGQTLMFDGMLNPITILAAADYIRSLDTFKED